MVNRSGANGRYNGTRKFGVLLTLSLALLSMIVLKHTITAQSEQVLRLITFKNSRQAYTPMRATPDPRLRHARCTIDAPPYDRVRAALVTRLGLRDFAAAVLLPHAAAAAAALQRQSAAVVLAAHVELLGTIVISGFKAAVCGSMAAPKDMQTLGSGSRKHSAAVKLALCSGSRGIFAALGPFQWQLFFGLRHSVVDMRHCVAALFLAWTPQKYSPAIIRGLASTSFAHLANVPPNLRRALSKDFNPTTWWAHRGPPHAFNMLLDTSLADVMVAGKSCIRVPHGR
ncbi:hypothetical protein DFH08DRAFT_811788 [Mycena albidolilacea]|uniref:Uncharacterized protein n=1 Tax=Mycena albidolilacea TaxID=1033008 RepID=A0AAD7EPE1_9AGAR|nr:hypothetical protein DFH08DRAFT_811788 [Mycena albidolilacea]